MENKDLDNFEWVKARAACSLVVLFERLKMDLKNDVDERHALLSKECPYRFTLVTNSKSVKVLVEGPGVSGSVEFRLESPAIKVFTASGQLIHIATPTLNDKGDCRLKVGEQECEPW